MILVIFLDDSPLHCMVSKSLSPSTGGTITHCPVTNNWDNIFPLQPQRWQKDPPKKAPLVHYLASGDATAGFGTKFPHPVRNLASNGAPRGTGPFAASTAGTSILPGPTLSSFFCCQRSVQRREVSIVCHTQTHCDWRALWLAQDRASRLLFIVISDYRWRWWFFCLTSVWQCGKVHAMCRKYEHLGHFPKDQSMPVTKG